MTPVWLIWLEAVSAAGDEIVLAVAQLSLLFAVVMLVIGAGIAPQPPEVTRRPTADGGAPRTRDRLP